MVSVYIQTKINCWKIHFSLVYLSRWNDTSLHLRMSASSCLSVGYECSVMLRCGCSWFISCEKNPCLTFILPLMPFSRRFLEAKTSWNPHLKCINSFPNLILLRLKCLCEFNPNSAYFFPLIWPVYQMFQQVEDVKKMHHFNLFLFLPPNLLFFGGFFSHLYIKLHLLFFELFESVASVVGKATGRRQRLQKSSWGV